MDVVTPLAVTKMARKIVDGFEQRLGGWLHRHVAGCTNAEVQSLQSSTGGGLSGETYVVSLSYPQGTATGAPTRVVVRKDVQQNQTNPQSSFANLVQLQTALGSIPGLGVPAVLGYELSAELLGGPFVVMQFVAGDIPSDVPSYAAAGFVRDATVAQRRKLWQSGVDFLVRLHRLDWRQHDLGQLRFDAPGEDDLERCLNRSITLFRAEAGSHAAAICEQAIAWLKAQRPKLKNECICWGDARIGNIIWQDFECAAAIDWEMSSLGCPGVDLGWWSFFHRWSTYGQELPDLEGLSVGQELADLYVARGGMPIADFRYYEVLANIRGLSIWLRTYSALRAAGALPEMNPLGSEVHIVKVLSLLMRDA